MRPFIEKLAKALENRGKYSLINGHYGYAVDNYLIKGIINSFIYGKSLTYYLNILDLKDDRYHRIGIDEDENNCLKEAFEQIDYYQEKKLIEDLNNLDDD